MSSAASILQALGPALAIATLLGGPGLAWAWVLRPATRLEASALVILLGLTLILLPAVVLAECGILSAPAIWITAAVLTAAGLTARRRAGAPLPRAGAGALLLVPALALLAGLAGGLLVSLVLVTRVVGIGAWVTLPWGDLLPAVLAIAARLLAGLPLALLWLSPLILLVVLLSAWFRRWAWVILGVGLGLGGQLLDRLFGQPLLSEITFGLLRGAGKALVNAGEGFEMGPNQGSEGLRLLPAWAWHDFGLALRELPSPLLAGGLLFAAGCFALLIVWRQRGAGAAG